MEKHINMDQFYIFGLSSIKVGIIQELISGVKTLADVERVQQILQSGGTATAGDEQNGHGNAEDVEMEES